MTTIETICFTDLKDSTLLTEKNGHAGYLPHLLDHLHFGKTLAEIYQGIYVKNIGDAHMIRFNELESAIQFATTIQMYCSNHPLFNSIPMQIRVSLFVGPVMFTSDDVFGSAVNKSARVQKETSVGQIMVNKQFVEYMENAWGTEKSGEFFTSEGEYELKGIVNPPTQELFSFNWVNYSKKCPDESLPKLIFNHLHSASVELFNITVKDLSNPGTVIWPVVPRALATAIHRGQAEIIRLLGFLDWKVKLLIVDCGSKPVSRSYSESFFDFLQKYLGYRNFNSIEAIFMDELYSPSYKYYNELQLRFRSIATDLSLEDLLAINNKKYKMDIQDEIKHAATLDFLRPALTTAAVLHLASNDPNKCLVVAGLDEQIQWERAIGITGARAKFGVLMNPVLKMDGGYQGRQRSDWPIWNSSEQLIRQMEHTNLGWWTFKLHVILPSFPSSKVQFGENILPISIWENENEIPDGITKQDLAQKVWPLLDPGI